MNYVHDSKERETKTDQDWTNTESSGGLDQGQRILFILVLIAAHKWLASELMMMMIIIIIIIMLHL